MAELAQGPNNAVEKALERGLSLTDEPLEHADEDNNRC